MVYLVKLIATRNVFIFPFGQSLLYKNRDLPILLKLKKTVIVNIGLGSDARPPYLNGNIQHRKGAYAEKIASVVEDAKRISRKVAFLENHSSYVIGSPLSSFYFLQRKFINFFSLGLPVDRAIETNSQDHSRKNEKIRVVHIPSSRSIKGTDRIEEAISDLIEEGLPIDYVELSNLSNKQVMEELASCDLVIDQLYSDTPLATIGTEAGLLGKPTVIGGYGTECMREYISDDMMPPSLLCPPAEIKETIKKAVINHELRERTGKLAKVFLTTQWSIESIARRYLKIIENDIPDSWWIDPMPIRYFHGAGLAEEKIKENIKLIVEKYGKGALCLSHNAELEIDMVRFSER